MGTTSKVLYLGDLRTECVHIKSGTHISTDAPTDNMGKGALFSPTDLVATSLAACMITVMGIKANASNIPFQNIEADVEKIMASNPRRIAQISVIFNIKDEWSDREKKILEKTAHTCPVARSLGPDVIQDIRFIYS